LIGGGAGAMLTADDDACGDDAVRFDADADLTDSGCCEMMLLLLSAALCCSCDSSSIVMICRLAVLLMLVLLICPVVATTVVSDADAEATRAAAAGGGEADRPLAAVDANNSSGAEIGRLARQSSNG
jgi:hypothetical protein